MRLGDGGLDLPFEESPSTPLAGADDMRVSGGVVVMGAVVDVPDLGNRPALVFRFATPDGDFYPPMVLVLEGDQAYQVPQLVEAASKAALRGVLAANGGQS